MRLLIVESPAKRKKLEDILGDGWRVEASVGHVRDLPKRSLGVNPTDFSLVYEITKPDVVAKLKDLAARASEVYLATDPDREGEAIAWHLSDLLGLHRPKRVRFNALTPETVRAAVAAPTTIDDQLVQAQEARRALDRLVGYRVSPALSDKAASSLSAGRVQTVAVELVVRRDREIANFVVTDHLAVELQFAGDWRASWHFKPFLTDGAEYWLATEENRAIATQVREARDLSVLRAEDKPARRSPPPPFTTSTLQQAASVSLRLRPRETMQLAQRLFEGGHITYHRVDSPALKPETIDELRAFAQARKLPVADRPRNWKAKAGAQEAHEAIRPTHFEVEHAGTTDDERRLYQAIWARTIASQLADAIYDVRRVVLRANDVQIGGRSVDFGAQGRTLRSPGWLTLMPGDQAAESPNGPDSEGAAATNPIPPLAERDVVQATSGRVLAKKTQPPSKYTEAALIKALEAEGVGRPSTYAAIMTTIVDRAYVAVDAKLRLTATDLGGTVVDALRPCFRFVDPAFTAGLEGELDAIARGASTYLDVVRNANAVLDSELTTFGLTTVSRAAGADSVGCPSCGTGFLTRRKGKKGFFWSCSGFRAGSCKAAFPDQRGKPDFTPRAPRVEGCTCPQCQKHPLVLRQNERGKWWGCAGWAEGCKATFPDKDGAPDLAAPRPVVADGPKCPKCKKGVLRSRSSARGAFWGCSRYPKCKATFPDVDGSPALDRGAA